MAKWIDTSHFSRSDTDRTPNEFTLEVSGMKLVLHHYVGCGNTWFASSHPDALYQRALEAKSADDAKKEAVRVLKDVLESMLDGIRKVED